MGIHDGGYRPAITQHPSVPDVQIVGGSPATVGKEDTSLVRCYENGSLIVFTDACLPLTQADWAFLDAMKVPADVPKHVKKAKLSHLLTPVRHEDFSRHPLAYLCPSMSDAVRLQGIMRVVDVRLREYVAALFPTYRRVDGGVHTWRLTHTEFEAMHYDSYGTDTEDHQHVRLFVNLDTKPRVWATSLRVDDCIRLYHDRCRAELRTRGQLHPNLFNAVLNNVLPWEEMPRSFVSFAPGNLWLVNSQVVSHEAIFGRKLIAYTFDVDPSTMLDPTKNFVDRVRRACKEVTDAGA